MTWWRATTETEGYVTGWFSLSIAICVFSHCAKNIKSALSWKADAQGVPEVRKTQEDTPDAMCTLRSMRASARNATRMIAPVLLSGLLSALSRAAAMSCAGSINDLLLARRGLRYARVFGG
jgi:hypothetical protein